MEQKSEKLRDACQLAMDTLKKLKNPQFNEIISKLEFVIGSYNYDKNPVGLIEFGKIALGMLKEVKKKNPRKFGKDIITKLEESLM
ncbi:MAG: hypothetical protein JXK95_09800 [Bacteroidales bacterium]|nr:hypothetical protein [Bacteroidales bacterium]